MGKLPLYREKPYAFNWDKEIKETPRLYKAMMPVAKFVLGFRFSEIKVYGAENLPKTGAFLITPNHVSGFDPITVTYVLHGKRQLYFMAKEEFYHTFYTKYALDIFHGFPVNREKPDRQSLRFAKRVLEAGLGLLVFPQGTRDKQRTRPNPEDGKVGVAMLARDEKVPVLPVSIHIDPDLNNKKPKCIIRIGELIPYEELGFTEGKKRSAELRNATLLIMEKVCELWDLDVESF